MSSSWKYNIVEEKLERSIRNLSPLCRHEIEEAVPNIIGSIGIYGQSNHDVDILLHSRPSDKCLEEFLRSVGEEFSGTRVDVFHPPNESDIEQINEMLEHFGVNTTIDPSDTMIIESVKVNPNGDISFMDIGFVKTRHMSLENQYKLIKSRNIELAQRWSMGEISDEEFEKLREENRSKMFNIAWDFCSETSEWIEDFLSCMQDFGFYQVDIASRKPNWREELYSSLSSR